MIQMLVAHDAKRGLHIWRHWCRAIHLAVDRFEHGVERGHIFGIVVTTEVYARQLFVLDVHGEVAGLLCGPITGRMLGTWCGKCKETVTVAPPPESSDEAASLTKGSQYGFGVTAQIILGKYADHLPLYRLEDVFARAGVVIPRSTQVGLLDAVADLLAPLCSLMFARLLASHVIGMDDTPVRLQDLSLPGKMRTARMWLAGGRETSPYNALFCHDSRERAGQQTS